MRLNVVALVWKASCVSPVRLCLLRPAVPRPALPPPVGPGQQRARAQEVHRS